MICAKILFLMYPNHIKHAWHIEALYKQCGRGKKERRREGGRRGKEKRGGRRDDGKEFEGTFIYVWATPGKQENQIVCLEPTL